MARASVAGRSRVRRWLWTIAAAFLAVAVLSRLIWGSVLQRLPTSDFGARAAAFGDIAGALFSALAFALLIVTALMQREELSLQREELRETREELKRAANAQEDSEKALRSQVETAQLTARLNAANTFLEYFMNLQERVQAFQVARRRTGAVTSQEEEDFKNNSQFFIKIIGQILEEIRLLMSFLENSAVADDAQVRSTAPPSGESTER